MAEYDSPASQPDFYDAEEQKNINQKKFDRLWEIQQQVRQIRLLISVDPDNKGVFVKMILQNGVVEEKYIDHPERSYARAVQMLYDLCSPEIARTAGFMKAVKIINEKYSGEVWFHYPKYRMIFRRLIKLIDDYYGHDSPVSDEI